MLDVGCWMFDVPKGSWGEEARFCSGFPSPRSSPHSFLAGRGRRTLSFETVSPRARRRGRFEVERRARSDASCLEVARGRLRSFSNRIFHFFNRRWIFQRRDIAWLFSQIRRANDEPHHFRISRLREVTNELHRARSERLAEFVDDAGGELLAKRF